MFNSCLTNLTASLFMCQLNAWRMKTVQACAPVCVFAFVCLCVVTDVCVVACAWHDSTAMTTNEDAGERRPWGSNTQTHRRWNKLHSRRHSWHIHAPHTAACSQLHRAFRLLQGYGTKRDRQRGLRVEAMKSPAALCSNVLDWKLTSLHKF